MAESRCRYFNTDETTYVQKVEGKICEWTNDIDIEDKLWFSHTVCSIGFLVFYRTLIRNKICRL